MPKIEIIIGPKGETKLETKGFTGSACKDASRAIEKALGQVSGETNTPEYYAAQETHQHETT